MSELKTSLEQILQEKTTKLIPENIKRKVEIFDVTGTDGDAEVEELQAKIIETRQEIADTRRDLENSAATVTGTGENVTLNQTAEARFKKPPLPMGNSEQFSTTGKNLWINEIENGETINGITVTKNADGSLTFNGTATDLTQFYFVKNNSTGKYLEANQPYTLSGVKNSNTALSSACVIGGVGNSTTNDVRTITLGTTREITKDNSFIRFSQDTVLSNYTIKPFIELGTTQGEYEPYTNGASPNPDYPEEITNVTGDVEVVVENKNLIDYTTVEATPNTTVQLIDNGFKATGKYAGKIVIENLKPNTNYYLQYIRENIIGSTASVVVFAGTSQSTTIVSMQNPSYFNTGENTTINIWFYASMGGADGETNFTNIQLEEGTTATTYTPHQEQTFTFPLGNEKLMLGDYLADDGIHHVRKQVEVYISYIATLSNENVIGISNLQGKINKANNYLISEKAIFTKNTDTNYQQEGTVYENASNICFVGNTEDTLQSLRNKYNGSLVEYELEQEVIVPYTSAQQEVYDAMKRAISYEGQTNVIGSSGGSNPIFTVTAFRDADLVITSLDNQLTLKE